VVKIEISSTFMCKKISKWENSLKMSIVKKLLGLEGLRKKKPTLELGIV